MPGIRFSIQTSPDGSYRIESDSVQLNARMLPPRIEGDEVRRLSFQHPYREQLGIGEIRGTVEGDVSDSDGIEIFREVFLSDDRRHVAIRMRIRNNREKAITLSGLIPLAASEETAIRAAGGSFIDWRIVRMGRQKSDIPGSFSFQDRNEDYTDATYDASKLTAGMGPDNDADTKVYRTDCVVAEPCMYVKNRRDESAAGLFFGVIGQDRHLTTFAIFPSEDKRSLRECRCFCEFDDVLVDPGEERETHWVLICEVRDESTILRDFTEIFAQEYGIAPPSREPLTVYCSWQFYGFEFGPHDLEENLAYLASRPMPIDVFQLDNGWIDAVGDWNPNHRFPMGMEPIARRIRAAGFIPGIWTCPLVLMRESKMFKEHPELAARRKDGSFSDYKYVGGPSCPVDPTSPLFEEYIHGLYAKLRGWGYGYHKLDFLRSIIVDEDIRFHDPKVNRAQAYRIANRVLREAIADGYFASCGGIQDAGNAGFADSMRVGADTYGFWRGDVRPKNALIRIKENVFRNYTNRLWHTDPDALCLRRREKTFRELELARHTILSYGRYNDEEAFTLVVNQYLGGGNVCLCERLCELDEDRRALYRHVIPSIHAPARMLRTDWPQCGNFFLTEITPKAPGLGRWWTLSVSNWTDSPVMQEVDLGMTHLPDEVRELAVFEFFHQRFEGVMSRDAKFMTSIPPHGTRLFRLAPWDGAVPVLLGTDLHLSGGGCEIKEIEVDRDAIRGSIETAWEYPVRITALFPFEDRRKLLRTLVSADDRRFELSLQASVATKGA